MKKLTLILATLFLLLPASLFATEEIFLTQGAGSWTCPAGVTSIQIEGWGGGGAGAGTGVGGHNSGGAGGGAYSKVNSFAVTPSNSYNYVVGAKGTKVAETSGNPGGDTTFNSTTCVAKGGLGGVIDTAAGQLGGQASAGTGDVKYNGGTGGNAASSHPDYYGGGGGSSGGTEGNGNNAGTAPAAGAAPTGGYAGAVGGGPTYTTIADDNASTNYGGAGGSCSDTFGTGGTLDGGNGTAGRIVLTYTAGGGGSTKPYFIKKKKGIFFIK